MVRTFDFYINSHHGQKGRESDFYKLWAPSGLKRTMKPSYARNQYTKPNVKTFSKEVFLGVLRIDVLIVVTVYFYFFIWIKPAIGA